MAKAASKRVAEKKMFFELEGNPVELEYKKFPVMYVKGKPKVYRDFFKLFHDGNEIDEQTFDRMIADQTV